MTRRQSIITRDILTRDAAQARIDANAWVITESRGLAPYSYAELHAAHRAGGTAAVEALLIQVPAHLVRYQAIRFLAERCEAFPERLWGWGDVDALEARFRAVAEKAPKPVQILAPHSYAEVCEAEAEGTLGMLLAELPAHLVEAQATRWLIGRKAATGEAWVWADVRSEAQRFAALAQAWRQALRDGMTDEAEAEAQTALDERDEAGDEATVQARMLAVLAQLEAEASAAAAAAKADGDTELARIARRSAQACRDAVAIVSSGGWIEGENGSLLVNSRSAPGSYHRVGRNAEGRVTCTCPWHEREGGRLGPCAHQAVFDAWERVG